MEPTIIAAIIGAIALIIATLIAVFFKRKQKRPSETMSIACKLGYTLVQLSRLAQARMLPINDDTSQRIQYRVSVDKASILSKNLGLSYPSEVSYDNHEDRNTIGHFDTCFEAFPKTYRQAYKIGKTLGNITLNMLPNYLAFKTSGESRYIEFLEMAEESFESLKEQWQGLFSKAGNLSKLSDVIESMGKRPLGIESIDKLVRDLEKVSQDVLDKFENEESKEKS